MVRFGKKHGQIWQKVVLVSTMFSKTMLLPFLLITKVGGQQILATQKMLKGSQPQRYIISDEMLTYLEVMFEFESLSTVGTFESS